MNSSIEIFNITIEAQKSFAKDSFILKQHCLIIRTKVSNAIVFVQINAKYYYNSKHQLLDIKFNNQILI